MFVATRFLYFILAALLCGCSENSATPSRDVSAAHISIVEDSSQSVENGSRGAFEEALREFQKAPGKINELRVSVDNQDISLLSAALLFQSDINVIQSLLDGGADIKKSDSERSGILHAIIENPRWSDEEKEALIKTFFDKRGSEDDINANRLLYKRPREAPSSESFTSATPWGRALDKGYSRTANMIIEKMPFRQVNEDGLVYAVMHSTVYGSDTVHKFIQKSCNADHFSLSQVQNRIGGRHLWVHTWTQDHNPGLAISIIKEFLPRVHPINNTEMAREANQALEVYRDRESSNPDTLAAIESEWKEIKSALIHTGVPPDELTE